MNGTTGARDSHDVSPAMDPRRVMASLAAALALLMTSYVMILPLFARRFTELGAGVSALGASSMAYALAATLCAPLLGALADRIGRRPVIVGSLAAHLLAFTGLLLAASPLTIIVVRGLLGALAAGMIPAATGMVADLAPEHRRAQWIGVLSGGASFGWIAGPILGGLFYDRWGFSAALLVSIAMSAAALLTALAGIRETRHLQELGERTRPSIHVPTPRGLFRSAAAGLPSSLGSIVSVFLVYFTVMFAWAFIEPRFMYYTYDDLGWSSFTLGLAMSTYGVAIMLGEFGLSHLSDDLGRKPVILAGLLLFSAQFLGLALSRNSTVIVVAFVIAGFGNALYDPALSASLLDVTPVEHQAQMLGLKSTVGSIGSILGPAAVVLLASPLQARWVFLLAACSVFLIMLIVIVSGTGLRGGRHVLHRPLPAEPLDKDKLAIRAE